MRRWPSRCAFACIGGRDGGAARADRRDGDRSHRHFEVTDDIDADGYVIALELPDEPGSDRSLPRASSKQGHRADRGPGWRRSRDPALSEALRAQEQAAARGSALPASDTSGGAGT
jgi:hypothetical protein